MKIKILETYYHETTNYEGFYEYGEQTNWDEVSKEDFDILLKWAKKENSKYNTSRRIVIITEKDIDIPKTIKDFLSKVKKETEEQSKKDEARRLAEEKRIKTIENKKKQKELRLLEQLRDKYEGSKNTDYNES